jgi:aspartate beta-hydroxylase
MASPPSVPIAAAGVDRQLAEARKLDAAGAADQAERIYRAVLDDEPGHPAASVRAAEFALGRKDFTSAEKLLRAAHARHPDAQEVATLLSTLLAATGRGPDAIAVLETLLKLRTDAHVAWLLLGAARGMVGDRPGALQASYQAISKARRMGQWLDSETTPAHLRNAVAQAADRVKSGRKELFFSSYENLREQHGSNELRRVDRALLGYLKELDIRPSSDRQKPLFLYFPDLPDAPYQDPYLQPWAKRLHDAYPYIRDEALRVTREDAVLPEFISLPKGRSMEQYLGGESAEPSWQAFFFYRHGKRHEDNHERCPQTSALLESIDLCRIDGQAPEICFSLLRPQTIIKPHFGVTNVRLVMHLPLVVPEGCALNVVGLEERAWREGELLLFDDTYQHEAWNHSDRTRIILLMDCWNPHLTAVERLACKQLIELIGSLNPRFD